MGEIPKSAQGIVSELPEDKPVKGWERANSTLEAIKSGAKAATGDMGLPQAEIPTRGPVNNDSLDALAVRSRLRNLSAGAEADFQESLADSAATRFAHKVEVQKTKDRKVKLLTRIGLTLGALGIGAGSLLGIKGRSVEKPQLDSERKTAPKERILDNQVNRNLQDNLENGNNADDLEDVEVDRSESADVNQTVRDNLEEQNKADDAGRPVNDGLDTSKLE